MCSCPPFNPWTLGLSRKRWRTWLVCACMQVCWSPHDPTYFLSSAADWTVKLWSTQQSRPVWSFHLSGSKAEVQDVQWCPQAATAFAAAAGNTLQLWDIEQSVLKPRASATRYGLKLTALRFSPASPVLACGADDGSVVVYSVAGLEAAASWEEEKQRLQAALCSRGEQAGGGVTLVDHKGGSDQKTIRDQWRPFLYRTAC